MREETPRRKKAIKELEAFKTGLEVVKAAGAKFCLAMDP
jgi:hypothetical protein